MTAPGPEPRDDYERAACGLLVIELDGAIRRANPAVSTWTGRAPEELLGLRFQDLLTVGSKLFYQTHWQPLLRMQGSVAEVQFELRRRDGQSLAVLVNAARRGAPAVPAEGELVDVAVFVAADRRRYERELLLERRRAEALLESERRAQLARSRAEAELRLALDSASLFVWSVEMPTGARRYERGAAALVGEPGGEVTAEEYMSRVHPDDREREASAFAAAVDPARREPYAVEYRLAGRDEVERAVRSTGRAFFDDAGGCVAFSGVIEDVTERRRAEATLREQEVAARQRAELAEQLIGIVSHDLRNPLSVVMLGARLLGVDADAPRARTVQRIVSAVQRAERLINDLLDLTQARLGGGLRVSPRRIDLHAVVADCVEELRLTWPGRAIEHARRGDGDAWGDPDRLTQALVNLVNNAFTYGDVDAPVEVTSRVVEGASELRVRNRGPAIAPSAIEHIFEPMRRGQEGARPGSRSVGLGLFIVRAIAEAHGGAASVRSSEAEGTTFALTLPGAPA